MCVLRPDLATFSVMDLRARALRGSCCTARPARQRRDRSTALATIARAELTTTRRHSQFIRTARLALYGGVIFSPVVTRWYMMLEGLKIRSKPARESRLPLRALGRTATRPDR